MEELLWKLVKLKSDNFERRPWNFFLFFIYYSQAREERADATEEKPSNSTTSVSHSSTPSLQLGAAGGNNGKQQASTFPPLLCPHFTQDSRAHQSPPFLPPFSFRRSVPVVSHQSSCLSPFPLLLWPVPFKKGADSVVLLLLFFCSPLGGEFQLHFLRRASLWFRCFYSRCLIWKAWFLVW